MINNLNQTFTAGWKRESYLTRNKYVCFLEILSNPDAEKALENNGAEQAHKVLMKADPSLESDLYSTVKKATNMLQRIELTELKELGIQGNPQKIIMLKNLKRAVEDIFIQAGNSSS